MAFSGAELRLQAGAVSLAGLRRQVRRIAVTVYLDAAERLVDLAQVVCGQLDCRGSNILLQPVHLRRPRDRHDPRLSRQQPRQGDLRLACPLLRCQ